MKLLDLYCFLVFTDSDATKLSELDSVSCQCQGDVAFLSGCRCLFSFALFKIEADFFSTPTPTFQVYCMYCWPHCHKENLTANTRSQT